MSGKESQILRWKNLYGPNSDLSHVAHTESGPNMFCHKRYQRILIIYYYTTKSVQFMGANQKFASCKQCKSTVGFETYGGFFLLQSKLSWWLAGNAQTGKKPKSPLREVTCAETASAKVLLLEGWKQIWAGEDLSTLLQWGWDWDGLSPHVP